MARLAALAMILAISIAGCSGTGDIGVPKPQIDSAHGLIVLAGRLLTGGPDGGTLTNKAIVVRDGKIVSLTTLEDARRSAPDLPVLDASNLTVLPGLVDAHAHIGNLGKALETVSLMETTSYEEVIERIRQRAARTPKGEWILGRGWDQNDWPTKEFPDAAALDRAVPDHPVLVERVDGHASLANSAAMRAAGVTDSSVDPVGGKIIRRADGSPSGVFVDAAADLLERAVPSPSRDTRKRRIQAAVEKIASYGLTAIHDAGVDQTSVELFQELADEGKLPIRVYLMLSDDAPLLDAWFRKGPLLDYRGLVTVRAVKLYGDGALGSRGAALLAPYADDPANSGLLLATPDHIQEVAARARKAGFQVNTHAIGDRAVRNVIEAYERAGVTPSERFRVEHLQVIALEDLPRLARLGIIASMQPTHATSDMPWAESRLGPLRILGAYAWRKVLANGGRLAFGSDFPVEEVNPWLGIYAAVTRQDLKGNPPGGWYPEEKLTLQEALRGFSSDASFAAFDEKRLGTIELGKLADLTIVAEDLESLNSSELHRVTTRFTIVGGKVVFGQ